MKAHKPTTRTWDFLYNDDAPLAVPSKKEIERSLAVRLTEKLEGGESE